MKSYSFAFFIATCFIFGIHISLSAQQEVPLEETKWQISGGYLNAPSWTYAIFKSSEFQWKNEPDESQLIKQIYNDPGISYYSGWQANTIFQSGIVLRKRAKESRPSNNQSEIRVGVRFGKQFLYERHLMSESIYTDTLVNQGNGARYLIDSTEQEWIDVNNSWKMWSIDFAYRIHTRFSENFSFYGGVQLSPSYLVNNNSRVKRTSKQLFENFRRLTPNGDMRYLLLSHLGEQKILEEEETKLRNGIGVEFGIPLGFRINPGVKSRVFSHLHFGFELRPSVHYLNYFDYKANMIATLPATISFDYSW